jgi:pilus assembly protein CpaD
MKKNQKFILSGLFALLSLGACATSGGQSASGLLVEDKQTILDVHKAEVSQVEARLLIGGFQGQLTSEEINDIKAFANDYSRLGRSNIIISYPAGGVTNGMIDSLVRATQRELYVQGVDFKSMTFGAYQPNGQINPLVLSFARYQAADVECVPWSQINPIKVAKNQNTVRFGCAKAANLTAMIVDPGDLVDGRKESNPDAAHAMKGIDDYRKSEITKVSGSISGGSN